MVKWLSLITGGIAGTVARYLLSGAVYQLAGERFPYGTLAVNLAGCALIGFLAALSEEKFLLTPNARMLLMAGFCGAFTTFSTFMFETAELVKQSEILEAFLNVVISVIAGFALFRLGYWLGEAI